MVHTNTKYPLSLLLCLAIQYKKLLLIFRYQFRVRILYLKKVFEELLDEFTPSFATMHAAFDGKSTYVYIEHQDYFTIIVNYSMCMMLQN